MEEQQGASQGLFRQTLLKQEMDSRECRVCCLRLNVLPVQWDSDFESDLNQIRKKKKKRPDHCRFAVLTLVLALSAHQQMRSSLWPALQGRCPLIVCS